MDTPSFLVYPEDYSEDYAINWVDTNSKDNAVYYSSEGKKSYTFDSSLSSASWGDAEIYVFTDSSSGYNLKARCYDDTEVTFTSEDNAYIKIIFKSSDTSGTVAFRVRKYSIDDYVETVSIADYTTTTTDLSDASFTKVAVDGQNLSYYSFTVDTTGNYIIDWVDGDTSGSYDNSSARLSLVDSVLYYQVNDLPTINNYEARYDNGASHTVSLESGKTYYIGVCGYGSNVGDAAFRVRKR